MKHKIQPNYTGIFVIIWAIIITIVGIYVLTPAKVHYDTKSYYTISKLCPNGYQASQEMNGYGEVINLECR